MRVLLAAQLRLALTSLVVLALGGIAAPGADAVLELPSQRAQIELPESHHGDPGALWEEVLAEDCDADPELDDAFAGDAPWAEHIRLRRLEAVGRSPAPLSTGVPSPVLLTRAARGPPRA
ncbi:MAG TPA: hypothetical protein RMH85_25490 [Polyangiaceae bacterium LLY-WYZ-15_(1-7)]|nr:hypothetical protein [Polyangiaceae bacterium LLY-WYZ-15_(1-7)]HJL11855.1 hypothetical protein [Polyangiaceae bacterium LLY-WYZ-15_(1-7)]HJL26322.1 hypothetical protein [Polyangiaceae bacterium LLY-WYZ-15_(1-7)]HJL38655.1 hypothetical protein [Polyangiaceae bacterium LLY-WYZ-15_(1-7)]HJL47213.1 hypothetical protein [Polyangiaceae bacterium LLY-WYZ-15_(1-7)]